MEKCGMLLFFPFLRFAPVRSFKGKRQKLEIVEFTLTTIADLERCGRSESAISFTFAL
jgi:hypothetical protein